VGERLPERVTREREGEPVGGRARSGEPGASVLALGAPRLRWCSTSASRIVLGEAGMGWGVGDGGLVGEGEREG
jgi:hypothetical protein